MARAALLISVVALAVLGWVFYGGRLNSSAVEAGIRELGPFAALMFVGAFALATVFFLPGSLFGLAGGIITGLVSKSSSLNSVTASMIAMQLP